MKKNNETLKITLKPKNTNGITSVIVNLYKIQAWVIVRTKIGFKDEFRETEIVVNNLKTARRKYDELFNKLECSLFYNSSSKKARCELFIPHIFEDGTLATWPDDENYIKQFIKD